MELVGPDSIHSWAIAALCCFIYTVFFGINRLSSFMFVDAIPRYQVGREAASFPFNFAMFVVNISGPLVGVCAPKFGQRFTVCFGCALTAIGTGLCYLAEHISTVTVLWGILFGFGNVCCLSLLPIYIIQYFDKQRGRASAFSGLGLSFGNFIFPPVYEFLFAKYGLSGTFLLLAGFLLNCVPASLLLRKPEFRISAARKAHNNCEIDRVSPQKNKKSKTTWTSVPNSKWEQCGDTNLTLVTNKTIELNIKIAQRESDNRIKDTRNDAMIKYHKIEGETFVSKENYSPKTKKPNNLTQIEDNRNDAVINYHKIEGETSAKENCFPETEKQKYLKQIKDTHNDVMKSNYKIESKTSIEENFSPETEKPKYSILNQLRIFSDPVFLLVVITVSIHMFLLGCFTTILIDFARDIGIQDTYHKYIPISSALGEVLGRLIFGWVADQGFVSTPVLMAISFISQALLKLGIALSRGVYMFNIMMAFNGMMTSVSFFVFTLIGAEFFAKDKQLMVFSCSSLFAAPLNLCVSPLIGLFRENIGSYKYMLFLVSTIQFFNGVLWLMTPCIVKCRKNKINE